VSDPFRDGMEAALNRSEMLEEENELLRAEITRIRQQATALKDGAKEASAEASALADQALGVLDQLEALSRRPNQVRVAFEGKPTGEMRPLDATSPPPGEAPCTYGGALDLPKPKPAPAPKAEPLSAPTAGVTPGCAVALVLVASFLSFVLGVAVAAGHR
jgi:hypothetical protein